MGRRSKVANDVDSSERSHGISELVTAWQSKRNPFNVYVSRVAEAYQTSGLSIPQASDWVDANEGELWAVLKLGTLDEDSLSLFDGPPPPKTTWLDLSDATAEGIGAALEAVKENAASETPRRAVRAALETVAGPSGADRVAALPGSTLKHMGGKAKKYATLSEKNQKAILSMASQKAYGKVLTPAQVAFMTDLLQQLVDQNVIRRDSPDGDQDLCDAVLDALGR